MRARLRGPIPELDYTLTREDTWVEYGLVPSEGARILSSGGSGARLIPLLARNPSQLDVVARSETQKYMIELRLSALRALSFPEYCLLLGYHAGSAEKRWELFQSLQLQTATRTFWEKHRALWSPEGFLLLGRWENHFVRLGNLLKKLAWMKAEPLFSAKTVSEQQALVKKSWSERKFRLFLRIALSEFITNRFLHVSGFRDDDDDGEEENPAKALEPAWKAVSRQSTRLFHETLLRKNFFAQLLFLGRLSFAEGFPPEAQPEIFQAAKTCATEPKIQIGGLVELTKAQPYDFYSLSDNLSRLDPESALHFVERLPKGAPCGTRVVSRNFLKRKAKLKIPEGWTRRPLLEKEAESRECTAVYEFVILEKV